VDILCNGDGWLDGDIRFTDRIMEVVHQLDIQKTPWTKTNKRSMEKFTVLHGLF
jgi:hypothetical protein